MGSQSSFFEGGNTEYTQVNPTPAQIAAVPGDAAAAAASALAAASSSSAASAVLVSIESLASTLAALNVVNTFTASQLFSANVGMGTETSPNAKLVISSNVAPAHVFAANTIFGIVALDGMAAAACIDAFASNGTVVYRRAQGTAASPANLSTGLIIGAFSWRGYVNGAFNAANNVSIQGVYTDSGTTYGSQLRILATPAGGASSSTVQAMMVQTGVSIGTGTTDPGSGGLIQTPLTFATLPVSPVTGSRFTISDGPSSPTIGATITVGGGTKSIDVRYNGINWTICGV